MNKSPDLNSNKITNKLCTIYFDISRLQYAACYIVCSLSAKTEQCIFVLRYVYTANSIIACVQAYEGEGIVGLQGRRCILYLPRSHTNAAF